jgi:hypothetical protein
MHQIIEDEFCTKYKEKKQQGFISKKLTDNNFITRLKTNTTLQYDVILRTLDERADSAVAG